ncbi:putative membrane-associated protein [Trypanosoma theileri]|uniref:Putative membrane-associated protein n=1 Tax=Trypanosoma theileri TaxID=67003 RepID=A0A1X0P6K7_9TRYP|nr:putative membrane-associated protein [Trypanosoma theileri]ORC92567.1 putative membrane-associated protein [Trypanosoma theileri]
MTLAVTITTGFLLIDGDSNSSEIKLNVISVQHEEIKKREITQNRFLSTSEKNNLNHSFTPMEATQSTFVNPYDIKKLLLLLQERPVSLQAELAQKLDLGVAYYIPIKDEKSCCGKQMKRRSKNKKNKKKNKNNVRHRIMAYHSLPHPTCLAELIFRYFKDIADELTEEKLNNTEKENEFLREGMGRKMFHNINLQDDNGIKNESFPFLPNSTVKLKRFMQTFNLHLKSKSRFNNTMALSSCWKMGGVIPGSSRHPSDAVFFDIADVYYAGGRFILFIEDNIIYTNSKIPWTSSFKKRRWLLRQEIFTDTEIKEVMQESIIPASKVAKVFPLRLAKVILHFGSVYPFVKGSWPQHTRDTLPLFVVFTKPLSQHRLDSIENNLERYTVGYYQEATDFQVPHHTLVELVITSFIAQQHFLRINKKNLHQTNQTGGHALMITSRPYYTHASSYSPLGCRQSFERCLLNGPWGNMYMGQLHYLSASVKHINCSISKKQSQECFETQLFSTFQFYNHNHNLNFQKRWVYGLRSNETQFSYAKENDRNNWKFNNSTNTYHIGNIIEVSNTYKDYFQSSININETVFHLEHLLIGYPTHCEPLLGLDPVYADIIHSLFRPFFSGCNYSTFEEFLENMLQDDKKKEFATKPSLKEWKQWIALFYFSYNDCQEHLSLFRKFHISKAVFDVLKEEGKLLSDIQKPNSTFSYSNNQYEKGTKVMLSLSEKKEPGNINDLISFFIVQASHDLVNTISLGSTNTNTTNTIQLSDAFRFILGNPTVKITTGIKEATLKGFSNETTTTTTTIATDYCSNDVFIFYSSRSGDWARDVVNDYVLLPKLPSDVEAELNKDIPFVSNNKCQPRRVYLRMNRFNQTLSFGKQLFSQMEAHRTTIFIGAPGANLLNSLFLRPHVGVITFSWGPTIGQVFYPTSVFPLYDKNFCENNNNNNNSNCNGGESYGYQTSGLLWRSVALKQICNHKIRSGKRCRLGADNVNNLFIGNAEYKQLVNAVVDIVREQDKIRRGMC